MPSPLLLAAAMCELRPLMLFPVKPQMQPAEVDCIVPSATGDAGRDCRAG